MANDVDLLRQLAEQRAKLASQPAAVAPTGLVRKDLGQTGLSDLFGANATPAQKQAVMATALSLLSADPNQRLSRSIAGALSQGMGTLQAGRQNQAAKVNAGRAAELARLDEQFKNQSTITNADQAERRLNKKDGPLVVNQFGKKPPTGYYFKDPDDPSKGVAALPGGPADKLSPEQGAKAQLIQGAMDNQEVVDRLLYDEDGTVNRTNLVNAAIGTPFTDGRSMNVIMKDSLEAKIRAESGAAVPETEVKRLAERFMPSVFDSDSTVDVKRSLLKQFLNGTYDKIDPNGQYNRTATIDAAIELADAALKDAPKEGESGGIKFLGFE